MRVQSVIVMTAVALFFCVPSLRAEMIDFEGFPALVHPAGTNCPPTGAVQAGIATSSGGGLIRGFPGFRFTNPSTFYVTNVSCSGASPTFTIVFSVPVSNVSLDLVPSVYEDDYISITDDTGNHQTELIPGTSSLNRPMKHVTLACSGCMEITLTTLTLVYSFGIDNISFDPAPVTLDFEIHPTTPEIERRVLISKSRGDDQFPSTFQDRDGRIKIRIRSSIAQAGISIYLRVVDPPDLSPYVPQPNQVPKDNVGAAGQLSNTLAVTDSGGIAETELIISAVAGDNYQIEASIEPAIRTPATPCGTRCVKSGILTAWKRVYAEVHKAFRQGTFLAGDVAPGATVIPVADLSNLPNPPFRIRLIHAPPVWDGSRTEFYSDDVEVKHIEHLDSKAGELHLRHPSAPAVGDTIQRRYAGPETPIDQSAARIYLADAVGVIDGTASSYETVDTSLVPPLFETAFVEVKWLKDDNLRDWTDPQYQRVIPRMARVTYEQREWLSRKWMRHASPFGIHRIAAPNHQILFLSDRSSGNRVRGEATVADGFNDAWLYTRMMGNATLQSEALTHELAHQWRVNHQWLIANPLPIQPTGGHCDAATGADRFIYNRPSLLCTMHSTLYDIPPKPGAADGIVGFHFITINGQTDSEYLRIRQRVDPVPQNEIQGRKAK